MINIAHVTTVIVTYGQRKWMLEKVLDSLELQGVKHVIVVNNGALWPVKSELGLAYNGFVDVIDIETNSGSAIGFKCGIERALDNGAEMIWLLDDDNMPTDDALQKLLTTYNDLLKTKPTEKIALRTTRLTQNHKAATIPLHRIIPRPSSFRGFHILDIPYKLWKRLPFINRIKIENSLPTISLLYAPYGGLIFHRDLISAIGLPNSDFVVYTDDLEFSYRITQTGGEIILVKEATIIELESSWNTLDTFSNGFSSMLCGSSDLRAYYSMRNDVHFFSSIQKRNKLIFFINRLLYVNLLFIFSLIYRKHSRYLILMTAIRDGLDGRLGVNDHFPLQ